MPPDFCKEKASYILKNNIHLRRWKVKQDPWKNNACTNDTYTVASRTAFMYSFLVILLGMFLGVVLSSRYLTLSEANSWITSRVMVCTASTLSVRECKILKTWKHLKHSDVSIVESQLNQSFKTKFYISNHKPILLHTRNLCCWGTPPHNQLYSSNQSPVKSAS